MLSAPLTLMVAIAQVGINLKQLQPATHGAVLAVAIFSSVIYPLLGRPLLRHEMNPARRGRIRRVIRSARARISLGLSSPHITQINPEVNPRSERVS